MRTVLRYFERVFFVYLLPNTMVIWNLLGELINNDNIRTYTYINPNIHICPINYKE